MAKKKSDNTTTFLLVLGAGVLGYLAGRYLRKAGKPEFSLDQGVFVAEDKATTQAAQVVTAEGGNLVSAGAVPVSAVQAAYDPNKPGYISAVGPFLLTYKNINSLIG